VSGPGIVSEQRFADAGRRAPTGSLAFRNAGRGPTSSARMRPVVVAMLSVATAAGSARR
jgi:hypothetical protein